MKPYKLIYTKDLKLLLEADKIVLYEDSVQQLRNCQAWIYKGYYIKAFSGEIIPATFLQSYNTLVACVESDDRFTCPRKYSPTTSKQVTWFKRDIGIR